MQFIRHVAVKEITWSEISRAWAMYLWPNRKSPIETHSAMTWPFEGNLPQYSMDAFMYPATFFGAFHNGILIGVNSGHKTIDHQYRSRGLWVDCADRKMGIAQRLLLATEQQAIKENCSMMWSMPRDSALKAYCRFGFQTVGDLFETETSEANIYVVKQLPSNNLA